MINITEAPPRPYLAWQVQIDDGTLHFKLIPVGSRTQQLVLYVLLGLIPLATGLLAVYVFIKSFSKVKFNEIGLVEKTLLKRFIRRKQNNDPEGGFIRSKRFMDRVRNHRNKAFQGTANESFEAGIVQTKSILGAVSDGERRRKTLIATLEYDIEDWDIKIKIGGLGVMASLMGKHLQHQDLLWVVPCCGGIEYPIDEAQPPMTVTILGESYPVYVQKHSLRNITYILLDAPVFRKQTKSEPYPPRMDDLESAIFYSAFNQCIASALQRYKPDLYHINDYHGTIAPLYLLPATLPCCLSLHNAEFQGLWPMRTSKESEEVCRIYNLSKQVVAKYVQFGSVFNLLHAGASYLRVHQGGFGAVGVSKVRIDFIISFLRCGKIV